MKIAFVHPRWPGAEGTGATHSATEVVRGLAERGHRVTLYTMWEPPAEADVRDDLELRPLSLGGWPYHTHLSLDRELRRRTEELGSFDVVTSYLPQSLAAVAAVGARTEAAVTVTLNAYGAVCPKNDLLHRNREVCRERGASRCARCILISGLGYRDQPAVKRWASWAVDYGLVRAGQRVADAVDAFRAPSGHVRDAHVEMGMSEESIFVIPHPLDERFDRPHASSFEVPYRLLYVGALQDRKGVDLLVPLLAEVRERLSREVELTVVGTGGAEEAMRRQARDLGVADHLSLEGFVPYERLPRLYAGHDLFVYPGRWEEPLARVYLEALGTGTPVLSTDYGGIDSILGEAGVAVARDLDSMARACSDLIRDGALPRMSEAAHRRADRFRRERVVGEIERMYEGLL